MRKRPCRATDPESCAFHLKERQAVVTDTHTGVITPKETLLPSVTVPKALKPLQTTVLPTKPVSEIEQDLLTRFKQIQFISHPSTGGGNSGIGKTFEDLLGKPVDNLSLPDFQGVIELKARDIKTSSKITLFTKALILLDTISNPQLSNAKINSFIFDTFGYLGKNGTQSLCISLSTQSITYPVNSDYGFKLWINHQTQSIELHIVSKQTQQLVFQGAGWTISQLIASSNAKLQNLALISAHKEQKNGLTHYNYQRLDMVDGIDGKNFVEAVTNGTITIEMRITTNSMGKMKDRGTAFRISASNLLHIYSVRNLA